MRLKPIALTCLLLLVAVALVLPWWIGRDTESRYRALVASTAGAPAPFRLQLEAFDRGWFTSRASVSVHARTPWARSLVEALAPPAGMDRLVLTDRIAHGLLPAPVGGLNWRPALATANSGLRAPGDTDSPPLAELAYRIRLDGGLTAAVTAPGSRGHESRRSGGLDWRDLRIHASAPARAGAAHFDLAAAELGVPQPLGRLTLHELDARLDARVPRDGLPQGTIEMSAREAVMAAPEDSDRMGTATDLVLRASFDGRGERAHGSVSGRLARMASPRETYGPGDFHLTVSGLDAASLRRLLGSLARLESRGLDNRGRAMAVAGALLAEGPTLLAHGPVLALESLELATPDGTLRARGTLSLESTKSVVLNNPYLLERAAAGSFEVWVPPSAARHAALIYLRRHGLLETWQSPEAWLAAQVSRGRLTRDNGDYKTAIRLADGRVTVNGRPWSEVSR